MSFGMKTKKQQELIVSFLDTLDNELGSLYQEIVTCLSELGYYPRKQRSYIVFKHDLHNKEMAKMGTAWTKDASPYFALRFSACTGYSQRFANVVKDYIVKNPNKHPARWKRLPFGPAPARTPITIFPPINIIVRINLKCRSVHKRIHFNRQAHHGSPSVQRICRDVR